METKGSRCAIIAIITAAVVVCVVALGFGLGLGLRSTGASQTSTSTNCLKPPSSSRLTEDSVLYVPPSENEEGVYRFASVASDAPICSSYGTEMMARHGGTAVDGAITAILCNGVYNPQSCGIGGGHFITYYKRSEKKAYSIIGREMAPSEADWKMFTNGTSSQEGGMAIAIPGEVEGLYEAWKLGGHLPWSSLFRPAIQMCREGFPVGYYLDYEIKNNQKEIIRNAGLRQLLTNQVTGRLLQKGDILKMPLLASTLEKIAADPDTFYNGSLAEEIAQDIADAGGIITPTDMGTYRAKVTSPLTLNLSRGYTVMSAPPPSSGAVVLAVFNILNGFSISTDSISTGDQAVQTFHRIAEALKHGFSVRTNLADADQESQQFKKKVDELLANMTSSEWGACKAAKITSHTHDTAYYEPTYDLGSTSAGTTQISVLGPGGDAVSITSSINVYFGSKVVGKRTGIIFNDAMDDFSTPKTTNFFGLPASPANFIKPYKRPLSSMSPAIVLDADGDVTLVTGSTGGSRIISSIALNIIYTVLLEVGLKESIELPRIHHQLLPPELRVEKSMPQILYQRTLHVAEDIVIDGTLEDWRVGRRIVELPF